MVGGANVLGTKNLPSSFQSVLCMHAGRQPGISPYHDQPHPSAGAGAEDCHRVPGHLGAPSTAAALVYNIETWSEVDSVAKGTPEEDPLPLSVFLRPARCLYCQCSPTQSGGAICTQTAAYIQGGITNSIAVVALFSIACMLVVLEEGAMQLLCSFRGP